MKFKIAGFRLVSAFALAAALFASPAAAAWQKEADMAGGWNVDGNKTWQAMVLVAGEHRLKQNLFIRVEPTLEYIQASGQALFDGGASLVARMKAPMGSATPFFDVGAGGNVVSRSQFVGRQLGGNFLFDLVFGAGVELKNGLAVSYRFRHMSNGGLFKENEGLDSSYIMVGYKF
ncbi:MAG: acyloxyacyl hydrolase [Nitrospiraceae bacterium]|nr:acyloxyacyl hydrolase [Nitrospiraceae bacterium]